MRPIRVLTWHVHGNYLYYLSRARVEFYLPTKSDGSPGYGGRGATFPFGNNVHDIPAESVCDAEFDCVLFQSRRNYEVDRHALLSERQRRLPGIALEHDPPLDHPTTMRHWIDDPQALLVHVTAFNALMWDSGRTPIRIIDHGVFVPAEARYTGELARGIVIINHIRERGRRLGGDIFEMLREEVPIDLVGMESKPLGGLGEIFPPDLPAFESRYRFYLHPIRYTSLGLALIEAMMVGLPIVGLATTELVTVIENGVNGFIETDPRRLVEPMRLLLDHPEEARRIGEAGRQRALERFDIGRFAREWEATFAAVTGR
ncbi:MAG TPA: glycosyltransferase family 4 protein [Planctomycetaceae bacterium]|nr:glycosyltransferase family 4 protein [Planctomycetaceae bacterium]